MIKSMIFGTVGGLGLFLFGMGLMSDGLKKVAGQKLKSLLETLTKHRVIGVIVGMFTTALIQSSSATTVMTVGFVNAGLLTLKQALSVVLGANIGTTITAFLVSALAIFKISDFALPFIGVGFLITILGKTQKTKSIGQIMLGFGILFIGIEFMKEAFDPLKDDIRVQDALIWLGDKPILAVLAGTMITMLLQSSSASIAMIQMLAFTGAFGTNWHDVLRVAIPFVLGDNIGTTITAQIAALQSSRNAKRAAMGHTIFNVIGVMYMIVLVYIGVYSSVVIKITPGIIPLISPWIKNVELGQETIMIYIFVSHFLFNVFNVIVFIPFIKVLETVVLKIIPVTEAERLQKPVVLEKHLLDTPVIALEQAEREIVRMAKMAQRAVRRSINGILTDDKKELAIVYEREDFVDMMQMEITSYLSALSRRVLSDEVSIELPVLLHAVNDLERVGDHAVNIAEVAQRKIDNKVKFSDSAMAEADQMRKEVDEMFNRVIISFEDGDTEQAKLALTNETNVNRMQLEFRRSHVDRMSNGLCTAEAGLIFIDLVDNLEKIGDHLTNIAQAMIGGLHWEGVKPKISKES